MNLHLVDGTYELFRAYYGAPPATAPGGGEVGATRSLLRALLTLCRTPGVTHLAVAFDTVIESFRNKLFAGYKTGEGIDADLWSQFPLAERAARALGITVWSMLEFEADDALATAAARWVTDVHQVIICSSDKDFGQCVTGQRVVLWDRMRDTVYDDVGVVAKFGVAPASIPDWLALVGDAADGIPGVPRWGAKSAATVLAHYHHLDAIPHDWTTWAVKVRGAASLSQSLEAHRTDVQLYRHLATLRRDVPLTETLDNLLWRGARRRELAALCHEIGDRRFLQSIDAAAAWDATFP